jgi:hypothetical protein
MALQHVWTVNFMTYGEINFDLNPGDALVSDRLCIADSFADAVEWLANVYLNGIGKCYGWTMRNGGICYLIAASHPVTGVVSTYSIIQDVVYKASHWQVVEGEEAATVQEAIEAIVKRVDWSVGAWMTTVVDEKPGTSPEEWEAAK